jgi:hypothetical protein
MVITQPLEERRRTIAATLREILSVRGPLSDSQNESVAKLQQELRDIELRFQKEAEEGYDRTFRRHLCLGHKQVLHPNELAVLRQREQRDMSSVASSRPASNRTSAA